MIKVYCNKCGKEITGNIHKVIEEVEAVDALGTVLVKFPQEVHYCDECQYKELTCGFKVGDQVITSTGKVGKITSICTCDRCKERGFYEPNVEVEIGTGSIWITDNDKRVDFRSFYQIGDQIFGNIDKDCIIDDIERKRDEIRNNHEELMELKAQLAVVNKLK